MIEMMAEIKCRRVYRLSIGKLSGHQKLKLSGGSTDPTKFVVSINGQAMASDIPDTAKTSQFSTIVIGREVDS